MIPYGKQSISIDDVDAVLAVLKSDWLTQGPTVLKFEEKTAGYCQAKYATATNSATSALHIACLALGLGKGDYLWTVPNTFVASSNCALYCGAKVDFVDINPNTYNISVYALESKLIEARRKGQLPKILVPVHFGGLSCEMQQIYNLSKIYGFKIIEDASHAIGAQYLDFKVGACKFSDITIFSFHPVKIITSGEGGVATTNSKDLWEKMQILRSHGITKDSKNFINEPHGPWYYEQNELGYNYRMTDIHAALGISQLDRVDEFVNIRQILAKRYCELLKDYPVVLPDMQNCNKSSFHLFPILVNSSDRLNLFKYLRENGVGVNVHYIPVYLQPYYGYLGFYKNYCKNAEIFYERTISLPIFPDLLDEEQEFIVKLLAKFYAA